MRINELLTELTFQGRTCTKDCSGHLAGYNYAMKNQSKAKVPSHSNSFSSGTDIAVKQMKTGKISPPRIRDNRNRHRVQATQVSGGSTFEDIR